MLYSLLEEELSESHLGLSAGARAHMDRFRAFIHGFYMTSLGYFPPPPADPRCSTIFKPEVYRAMRADFEALYEYLVDERYTTADNISPEANGGLCTLQSVHAFDLRHNFTPLPHPLPLLPAPLERKETRGRMFKPWHTSTNRAQCEGKLRPDQRLVAHAALMKATNRTKVHLLENDLVLAYRQFEQNFILSPHKPDRSEKPGLSQSDARKVRWLFVYAAYQALRDSTEVPAEVRCQEGVDYHLAVTTRTLLPWQAPVQDSLHSSSRAASDESAVADGPSLTSRTRRHSIGATPLAMSLALAPETAPQLGSSGIEIKPDIDYFALTHPDQDTSRRRPTSSGPGLLAPDHLAPPSRSRSTRTLSLRRSMSRLRNSGHQHRAAMKEEARAIFSHKRPQSPCKPVYHEIIVTGYGNGTNCTVDSDKSAERLNVSQDMKETPKSPLCLTVPTTSPASRSVSTSSSSSYGSVATSPSDSGKSDYTSPTTVGGSPRSSRHSSAKWDNANMRESLATTGCSEIPVASAPQTCDNLIFPIRRRSTDKSARNIFASDDMLASESNAEAPSLPRRSSKRFSTIAAASKRWTLIDVVAPLRQRDDDSDSDSDTEVSRRRTVKARRRKTLASIDLGNQPGDSLDMSDHEWETTVHSAMDVSPPWSWEQYTDLGGLQPASPSK